MWGKYTGRGKKTRASEGVFVTVCRFTHCHFADRCAYFHVSGNAESTIVIAVVLVMNAVLGTVQHQKAENHWTV